MNENGQGVMKTQRAHTEQGVFPQHHLKQDKADLFLYVYIHYNYKK